MEVCILSVITLLLIHAVTTVDQHICWYTSHTVGQLSVQHADTASDYRDEFDYSDRAISGLKQTCPKETNYCYALWKEVPSNMSVPGIIIIAQGCWDSSGKQDCENISCITDRKPPKALNDTNFCCCKGNFCNGNVTNLHYSENVEVQSIPDDTIIGKFHNLFLIIFLMLFLLLVMCLPAFIIYTHLFHKEKNIKRKNYLDSVHLMENGFTCGPKFTQENLKLEELIGQGRYGSVWKASIGEQEIAVKIFQSHNKHYFYNELDIYSVPFMAHPTLLSYYGCDERMGTDGNVEYLLFLSLVPNGTVQDFLHSNVVDWNIFCSMALSIAKGVAHLHSDIRKGDKLKPCISHRDLNTKNILIKDDLSCVICDLGFATKISGSKYYYNGEEQLAEVKSINDVGTLRYMSPEVLEGAINLRDCETALKQIDVYALGLILWEIATRCADFYPAGLECPAYRLPFEAEIGHPTFEQMQVLVCKHKARPLFPDLWKDSTVVRSVKETIEDCWDQDAEARLTALCVEERFHELSVMNERHKVSFYSSSPASRTRLIKEDTQKVLNTSDVGEESCASECTMDTTLAITPANTKNSNLFQEVYPPLSIQPYQGRNPCLERNLMPPIECDSNSDELIDKSNKSITLNRMEVSASEYFGINLSDLNTTENLTNAIYAMQSNHSESLLRSNAPIPFVQNVNVARQVRTPKQSNLLRPPSKGRKLGWKNWMRVFVISKKSGDGNAEEIESNANVRLITGENHFNLNLSTPIATSPPKLETRVSFCNGKLETKINAQDTQSNIKENERLSKPYSYSASSATLKRPNTLPLYKTTDISDFNLDTTKRNFDETVTKFSKSSQLSNPTSRRSPVLEHCSGATTRIEEKNERDTFNTNSPKFTDNEEIVLDKAGDKFYLKGETPAWENGNSQFVLKNASLRVSTPGNLNETYRDLKNKVRLSLYDDRMMSGFDHRQQQPRDHDPLSNSYDNIRFSHYV